MDSPEGEPAQGTQSFDLGSPDTRGQIPGYEGLPCVMTRGSLDTRGKSPDTRGQIPGYEGTNPWKQDLGVWKQDLGDPPHSYPPLGGVYGNRIFCFSNILGYGQTNRLL